MRLLSVVAHRVTGAAVIAVLLAAPVCAQSLTNKEKLGKAIFFDQDLSINRNQSCAACHAPEVGWTGPSSSINAHGAVYEGSIPGRFGDRKPPSSAYSTQSPILHQDRKGLFIGGHFWDGRATGEKLGNPAADQAQGPFLNPMEQALPDAACVVHRVCMASYPVSYTAVWGAGTCAIAWPANTDSVCASEGGLIALSAADRATANQAYDNIALAIAAYEASPESNAFTSKYDRSFRGGAQLSALERKGFGLFMGKGKCSRCHPAGPGALFTDFSYDNLGVPKNPENPVYLHNPGFLDKGLGGFLQAVGKAVEVYTPELGKVKVPTLRNVDKRPNPMVVKAFGHNGYFKSLEEIVHFYNTRDVYPVCGPGLVEKVNCWPAPEYPMNVNTEELGNLRLSAAEEAAIVAFLKTLSDGHQP